MPARSMVGGPAAWIPPSSLLTDSSKDKALLCHPRGSSGPAGLLQQITYQSCSGLIPGQPGGRQSFISLSICIVLSTYCERCVCVLWRPTLGLGGADMLLEGENKAGKM